MLRRAEEVITSGDERAAVDFAISMNRQVAQGKRELDRIKAHLRKMARRETLTEGSPATAPYGPLSDGVTLDGNIGTAYVQFPPKEARVRRGQDLRDIEVNLTRQAFYLLFMKTTVVKPAKDFLDRIGSLDAAGRMVVDRFIEVTEPTGKVNLPL